MKMMKKLMILLLAIVPMCMNAQSKVAIVNVNEIYNAMPEKAQAEAQLKEMSAQYQKEYKNVQDEFGRKYAAYQSLANDASVLPTIKERRMQEIQSEDAKIQQFLKQIDADLNAKRAELDAPIKAKIQQAIKDVGDAGGFTYIFDVSTTPIVYTGSDAVDLTSQVKARLEQIK